jgi:hypothetical protein
MPESIGNPSLAASVAYQHGVPHQVKRQSAPKSGMDLKNFFWPGFSAVDSCFHH